ncbi:hypothetical protein R84B8_01342 [Treponema sp. R8-4-B8]
MKTQEIKNKALELGYITCGIIPSSLFEEYSQYLDERIKTKLIIKIKDTGM